MQPVSEYAAFGALATFMDMALVPRRCLGIAMGRLGSCPHGAPGNVRFHCPPAGHPLPICATHLHSMLLLTSPGMHGSARLSAL